VRTSDPSRTPYGPYFTDNSLYNPQTGRWGGFSGVVFPDYPETQFNRSIVPPAVNVSGAIIPYDSHLLPYDMGWDASSPYGEATPNRTGYSLDLKFNFFKGAIQPEVMVDMAQQIVPIGRYVDYNTGTMSSTVDPVKRRPIEHYSTMLGGLVSDLHGSLGWPVRLSVGYRTQAVDGEGPWAPEVLPDASYPAGIPAAQIAFDSTRLDVGLEYYPVPSLGLFYGYRHLDYNGTFYDPNATVYGVRGQNAVHTMYETMGGGLRYFMSDRMVMDLLYTNQVYPDRDMNLTLGRSVTYQVEQIFGKFTVAF
jgi:hypothetical protein